MNSETAGLWDRVGSGLRALNEKVGAAGRVLLGGGDGAGLGRTDTPGGMWGRIKAAFSGDGGGSLGAAKLSELPPSGSYEVVPAVDRATLAERAAGPAPDGGTPPTALGQLETDFKGRPIAGTTFHPTGENVGGEPKWALSFGKMKPIDIAPLIPEDSFNIFESKRGGSAFGDTRVFTDENGIHWRYEMKSPDLSVARADPEALEGHAWTESIQRTENGNTQWFTDRGTWSDTRAVIELDAYRRNLPEWLNKGEETATAAEAASPKGNGIRAGPAVANPLPADGLYARVMGKNEVKIFLEGGRASATGPETFLTAFDDIKGHDGSSAQLADRLTLTKYKDGSGLRADVDTVIVFRRTNVEGIRTPIETTEGRAWGFKQGGRTQGGAREWVVDSGTIQELRAQGLEIDQIYSVDAKGVKTQWELAANPDGTFLVKSLSAKPLSSRSGTSSPSSIKSPTLSSETPLNGAENAASFGREADKAPTTPLTTPKLPSETPESNSPTSKASGHASIAALGTLGASLLFVGFLGAPRNEDGKRLGEPGQGTGTPALAQQPGAALPSAGAQGIAVLPSSAIPAAVPQGAVSPRKNAVFDSGEASASPLLNPSVVKPVETTSASIPNQTISAKPVTAAGTVLSWTSAAIPVTTSAALTGAAWLGSVTNKAETRTKGAVIDFGRDTKIVAEFAADKTIEAGQAVQKGFQVAAEQPVSRNVSDVGAAITESFTVTKNPVQAVKIIVGVPFSILSGDMFDRQDLPMFDRNKDAPAAVSVTGMACREKDKFDMAMEVNEALGIERSASVTNYTHINLPRIGKLDIPPGLGDIFAQMIGDELFDATDIAAIHTAQALREGIKEKGFVLSAGHSQGTPTERRAFDLLNPAERSKVYAYGAGSEWYIDEKRTGVASAYNARNIEDPVPVIGMLAGMAGNVLPWNWDRIADMGRGWHVFDSPQNHTADGAQGNKHDFGVYYPESLRNWVDDLRKKGVLR